jgi:hypothetical protein
MGNVVDKAPDAAFSLIRNLCPLLAKRANDNGGLYRWAAMPVSMKVCQLALLLWMVFHIACCSYPSIMAKPNHRAYFVCFPETLHSHRALLVLSSLALSSCATILAWGYGAMSTDGAPLRHPQLWTILLPSYWLLAGSSLVVNVWRQPKVVEGAKQPRTSDESVVLEMRPESKLEKSSTWDKTSAEAKMTHSCPAAEKGTDAILRRSGQTRQPSMASLVVKLNLIWSYIWPLVTFVCGTAAFYFVMYFFTENVLSPANRIPTYWRSMNLTSGVSPLTPLLALCVGIYLWCWYSFQGLSLLGPDRPVLPPKSLLEFSSDQKQRNWLRMFSDEYAGRPVESISWPFARGTVWLGTALFAVLGMISFWIPGEVPLRSLGAQSYGIFVWVLLNACVSLMLTCAWQLLQVWMKLRRLLTVLDRLRLRRSMVGLPGLSWQSIWKMSGNVLDVRYKLLTNEVECAVHLRNALDALEESRPKSWHGPCIYLAVNEAFEKFAKARKRFAKWYAVAWDMPSALDKSNRLEKFQHRLTELAAALIVYILRDAWAAEGGAATGTPTPEGAEGGNPAGQFNVTVAQAAPHVLFAEQLVCYVYFAFIQNVLGRMRSIAMSILWLFVAATVALSSYPFDPRPTISGAMVVVFCLLGVAIVFVYAQMHRDPTISLMTNTKPGELGVEFWLKLVGFAAGPFLGLLATIFPELTNFIFSWVQPSLASVR